MSYWDTHDCGPPVGGLDWYFTFHNFAAAVGPRDERAINVANAKPHMVVSVEGLASSGADLRSDYEFLAALADWEEQQQIRERQVGQYSPPGNEPL